MNYKFKTSHANQRLRQNSLEDEETMWLHTLDVYALQMCKYCLLLLDPTEYKIV